MTKRFFDADDYLAPGEDEPWQLWIHRALGEIVSKLDEIEALGVANALEDLAAQLREQESIGLTPERRAHVAEMLKRLREASDRSE